MQAAEQAVERRCAVHAVRLVERAVGPAAEEREPALPRYVAAHGDEGVAGADSAREREERVLVLPAAMEQDDGGQVLLCLPRP